MKRWSLRTRLTVAYVALTAVTGSIMLGLIVLLSDGVLPASVAGSRPSVSGDSGVSGEIGPPPQAELQPVNDLGTITYSAVLISGLIALVVVMAVAAVLGWGTARRALRPVRTITATAQRVADQELHMRNSLDGPADEIKELADAFDHMLMRLERSFTSQRRFLANAAHELKSPVATQRAVIEVTMARPGAPAELVELGNKLLAGLDHQQRVLDGLLTLAQNPDTIHRTERVDLAMLVDDTVRDLLARATERVEPALDLATAKVLGEPVLLTQLVHNLVDNAFVHNEPGGWVRIRTTSDGTNCALELTNGGPPVDDTLAEQLFEPFRRLCFDRAEPPPGSGLGLSVVRAIAEAHGGGATAWPRPEGGLAVQVVLPSAASAH
ncbi:sensor histidine kinase [Prauserella cavernicola]|uniref:histidine kinase n=1 Tax=Prauserella cavernicola TaxID=2800127 RepID=A0A934QPW7_9PSEU|nr:HAMP domain-containing sensor histidine kinase [Prauserella cavernicola]MBK1786022.1 HAMP domain-containing histidine kinase [Prauserella cavernicola]